MNFADRTAAGIALAQKLSHYKDQKDTLILGLPRGGVLVAFEVAKKLNLPLDILTPRKVGSPNNKELALGAVTHTGEGFFNTDIIQELGVSQSYLNEAITREKKVSFERMQSYRTKKEAPIISNKVIILVDDGLATGATMKAAIQCVKKEHAKKVVVAVPVSPTSTALEIEAMVDEFIGLIITPHFYAVGQFYTNFSQTTDEEVIRCLK